MVDDFCVWRLQRLRRRPQQRLTSENATASPAKEMMPTEPIGVCGRCLLQRGPAAAADGSDRRQCVVMLCVSTPLFFLFLCLFCCCKVSVLYLCMCMFVRLLCLCVCVCLDHVCLQIRIGGASEYITWRLCFLVEFVFAIKTLVWTAPATMLGRNRRGYFL